MNFVKAKYRLIYGAAAGAISLYCVFELLKGDAFWAAPLLVWAPLLLSNIWRYHVGNLFFQDERERPVMVAALLGMGVMLIAGARGGVLWCTLAGLFGLLLYLFWATTLPRGVREAKGSRESLSRLPFESAGDSVNIAGGPNIKLAIFFHSHRCPYSRMSSRELLNYISDDSLPLQASQILAIFPDAVPVWAKDLSAAGVHCWADPHGDSAQTLGLWLRGGGGFISGGNALRPALAWVEATSTDLWIVASNFRLPPSLGEHLPKIKKLCCSD